ncbi:hypothetical protein FA13DRAFT_1703905 [Coprinellus micaceus]|uniref:Uncharacterized protein n=1 Tax=Coprinellus micaceus TaxID=71717 RepID=A0A4Y7TZQ5_COPMI|nr:hypothetical protein FA13DRAFT_1703905 [Coprinellus micaceus]
MSCPVGSPLFPPGTAPLPSLQCHSTGRSKLALAVDSRSSPRRKKAPKTATYLQVVTTSSKFAQLKKACWALFFLVIVLFSILVTAWCLLSIGVRPAYLAFHLLLGTAFFALLSPKFDRRGVPGALPTSATCAHRRYSLIDHRLAPPSVKRLLTESTDDLEDAQRCSELALVRAVPSFNPSSSRSTVYVRSSSIPRSQTPSLYSSTDRQSTTLLPASDLLWPSPH